MTTTYSLNDLGRRYYATHIGSDNVVRVDHNDVTNLTGDLTIGNTSVSNNSVVTIKGTSNGRIITSINSTSSTDQLVISHNGDKVEINNANTSTSSEINFLARVNFTSPDTKCVTASLNDNTTRLANTEFVQNELDNLRLGELFDVTITSATTGHFLYHNGTNWGNLAATLTHLNDVDITSATAGHFLRHDGTSFVNTTPELNHLSDVNVSVSTGKILKYNGSIWTQSDTIYEVSQNVGIGKAVPTAKLHIYEANGTGASATGGTIFIDKGDSQSSQSIVFKSNMSNDDYGAIEYLDGNGWNELGILRLIAENDGDGGYEDQVRVKIAGSDRVRFASNGVSINTYNDPSYTLDVGGKARFSNFIVGYIYSNWSGIGTTNNHNDTNYALLQNHAAGGETILNSGSAITFRIANTPNPDAHMKITSGGISLNNNLLINGTAGTLYQILRSNGSGSGTSHAPSWTTLTDGTGVTITPSATDITFSIGQSVATTDDVTFNSVTTGSVIGGNNANIEFRTVTNSAETARIVLTNNGAIGIGGAENYGASGEVLTSQGDAPPIWSTLSVGIKPLFQVFGTSTSVATGSSGIYKLVNWSTPTIDQEAGSFGWDSTNSNYRCPLAGNYRVSTLVQWQGYNITNREIGVYIYLNNSQYGGYAATTFHDVLGSPEYQFASLTYIIPCSEGDTIDIRSDATTNLNVSYSACHFNVEFIQNSTSGEGGGGGGDGGGGSGVTFSLTLTHSGYSGINSIYMKEDDSTGTDLISPNPTSFSPRLEDSSASIGTITSSSTTIAISASANSGSSSYTWSGPSTITYAGFSSFYRIWTGFTNGSYALTVTSVDDD